MISGETRFPQRESFRPRPPQERAARQRHALLRLTRSGDEDFITSLRLSNRLVADTLEVERVGVWLFSETRDRLVLQALYERFHQRSSSGLALAVADYPTYFNALENSSVLAADDAQNDPRTREFREAYLKPLGITAMLDAPIFVEGKLAGMVCCEHVGPSRAWNEDEETFAVAVASFVALAIGQERRRAAERERLESEQRYRLVARATGDVIWDWDLRSGRVTWNEALTSVLGHEPSEEQRDPRWWVERIHPQEREAVYKGVHELIEGSGTEWSSEYRFRRGDGLYAHVMDRGTVLRDAEGKPIRMIGAMLDLTARLQAESALRESQERFRELADNIQGVFWLRELKTQRFVYVSPAFESVWGRPCRELIERPSLWTEAIHPDDRERAIGGLGDITEYRVLRPDGQSRWVRERAFPVRDEKGEIYRVAGIAEDVTDLKEAEEILRFQKSLLEAQNESSQDGILVTSLDGKILSHNRRVVELWGFSEGELAARSEAVLLDRVLKQLTNPEAFLARVNELRSMTDVVDNEELFLGDGRVFEHYSAPVRGAGRRVIARVWFYRDVTERQRMGARLRQSQKMEAIGRLAGGVAHDFNNLLTAILGYSDVLAAKLQAQPQLLQELGEIRQAGERAAALTKQLLAFSRQQAVQPKVLDLNQVVSKMENMLRRLIGEDVELRTRLRHGLGSVKADAGQLDQILMNLSVNARDAMPGGGTLTIETGDVDLDEAFTREHAGSTKGPHVLLRVKDTGVGMPKEVLAHVFEPFFTTKELGKGTGLGLATVYGIVKQNGGYVGVSSEPGKGTSFDIYLPRVKERPNASEETTSLMPIRGDERVLLVEDEAVVRGLARQALKLHGYTVIEAKDGAEALNVAASGESFDILITDLIMPKMGGRELARRLKEKLPSLPVLYMSGYSDDAAFREGGLESGSALISKPFSPHQFLHKVRKTLRAAQRATRLVAG